MELETMLALPQEQVRALAPRTAVWAAGGTRRQAALEGVPEAEYFDWAWQRQMDGVALFFALGVRYLFAPVLGPPQVREVGPYRAALFTALSRLGDEQSLAAYQRMGVRVRFYGHQHAPELAETLARVEAATRTHGPQTLWWSLVVEHNDEALWDALRAAIAARATSLEDAVRAFYGEVIPPVEVFVGFGKLQAGYLMPPLLGEHADLYWTAFPSYMLNERHLRAIFWDHRFARATWSADKSRRYEGINATGLAQRYQQPLILGVGRQTGPFWYPMAPECE